MPNRWLRRMFQFIRTPLGKSEPVALVVIFSLAVSTLLAFLLEPYLEDKSPLLPFTLAVAVSSWYGGIRAGLAATILGFGLADYFFIDPVYRFSRLHAGEGVLFSLFLTVGVLISTLQTIMAATNDRLIKTQGLVELAANTARIGFSEWTIPDKITWTPSMESLYGLAYGEFEGTLDAWLKRIHPDDREAFRNSIQRQVQDRLGEVKFEYRMTMPDGRTRWIEGRRRAVYAVDGSVVRIVGAHMDFTERRELEQDLIARSKELVRSNEELERFTCLASHDLKAPLRNIEGMTQLCLLRSGRVLDSESRHFLDMVISSADRLQHLIEGMLEFARLNAEPEQFRQRVDTDTLVEAIAGPISAETGARIKWTHLPTVEGDEVQLSRLFQNLIGNAIKYCEARTPEVTITAVPHGKEWVFSVVDNGIGIDSKFQDKIFDTFQRLHSSREYEGSGLGLSVCRRIVERHHGRIWVESALTKGSTFRFTLPRTGTETPLRYPGRDA